MIIIIIIIIMPAHPF